MEQVNISFKVVFKVSEIIQNFVSKFLSISLRSEAISGRSFKIRGHILSTVLHGLPSDQQVNTLALVLVLRVCLHKKRYVHARNLWPTQCQSRTRTISSTSLAGYNGHFLVCRNNARPDGSSLYQFVFQVVRKPLIWLRTKACLQLRLPRFMRRQRPYFLPTMLSNVGPRNP